LAGAALLYALNTVNLRAVKTIHFALSMIGSEEGRCLAIATKPNKNLNSPLVATRMVHLETGCPALFKKP
jgi:hypothetical protein